MKPLETHTLTKRITNECRKRNLDIQEIDLDAHIDKTLSYGENLDLILNLLPQNEVNADSNVAEALYLSEEQATKMRAEELEAIKHQKQPIEKFYTSLFDEIDFLTKSTRFNGLIVRGESGMGKSFNTVKYLLNQGFKENQNFKVISSYTTMLEFYNQLYEWKDMDIIILDDISGLYGRDDPLSILQQALWSIGKTRFVSYHSTSPKRKAPNIFPIKAKFIFLLNERPKNPIWKTIENRCIGIELDFHYDEKMKIFQAFLNKTVGGNDVMSFLTKFTNPSTSLSLRTVQLILEKKKLYENWAKKCSNLLKVDSKLAVAYDLRLKPTKEAVKEWTERTGMSKRSYYRYANRVSVVPKCQEIGVI